MLTYDGSSYTNYVYSDNGGGFSLLRSYSFSIPTIISFNGTFLLYTTNVSSYLFINIIKDDGSSYSVLNTSLVYGTSVFYFFSKGTTDYIYIIPRNVSIQRYENNGNGFMLSEEINFPTEGTLTSIADGLTYLFRGFSSNSSKYLYAYCGVSNCNSCSSPNVCSNCQNGTIYYNSSCIICNLTNCLSCNQTNYCINCINNFNPIFGNCIACQVPFCSVCNSLNVCQICNNGFTLDNNTCIDCNITGCTFCNSSNIC
jgi:hypothetical protein